MSQAYAYVPSSQLGGLKKVLRKIAGPVAAIAAVASGNPQLAVPAYSAASAATAKKKKTAVAVIDPAPPVTPGLFSTLTTADRNALLIGGGVLAAILLLKGRKR